MTNSVLDDRLKDQRRHASIANVRVDENVQRQLVAEPHLLDVEIPLDQLQLRRKRNLGFTRHGERAAQEITESGDQANGNVRGLANIYFAYLGIGTLTGKVSGSAASLSAVGTTSIKQGQCAYFVRATADFSLAGNAVNGTVTYRNETNHAADCGTLDTCTSTQAIAGSRPPR